MLIYNATILTFNEKNEVISEGAVVIEGGLVKAVLSAREQASPSFKKILRNEPVKIDAGGKVLMPGLINLHMHLYSTFARGVMLKSAPRRFTEILRNLWWKLDCSLTEADVYYSALIPLIVAIKSGVTTIFDHHASENFITGSLDRIAEAFEATGLRGCLCFEVSDRYGKYKTEEAIQENLRFMQRVKQACLKTKRRHSPHDTVGNLLTAKFGLHASFTLSQKTLNRCRKLAEEVNATGGFHIHCAEDLADVKQTQKKYGTRVVERLAEAGILGPATIAAHCVHIDENEMNLLAKTKTIVAHNPRSNMNNAVGVAPVLSMVKKNIRLGIGTDGMSPRVQDDFRIMPLLQKIHAGDPRAGEAEAFSAFFGTNAEVASATFGITLGKIVPGAAADLILVDYSPPTPITNLTLLGHLFFGLFDAPVTTTIVAGKILMKNGKLTLKINEDEIARQSQNLAKKMWERFQQ
ncbi:MAG: putative aminohydrolase SsnA [Candidatus Sumerlaeia bacterium]|nr:putative aminohydrolase SsnA [Candidatus Sumerlaeia bacterium]